MFGMRPSRACSLRKMTFQHFCLGSVPSNQAQLATLITTPTKPETNGFPQKHLPLGQKQHPAASSGGSTRLPPVKGAARAHPWGPNQYVQLQLVGDCNQEMGGPLGPVQCPKFESRNRVILARKAPNFLIWCKEGRQKETAARFSLLAAPMFWLTSQPPAWFVAHSFHRIVLPVWGLAWRLTISSLSASSPTASLKASNWEGVYFMNPGLSKMWPAP